jgi:hypothetical protein
MSDIIPNLALIQKAIVQNLRNNAYLVSLLGDVNRIKENQTQRPDFTYPAIRVDVGQTTPIDNAHTTACIYLTNFNIYVFSEQDSSYQCNDLTSEVVNNLYGRQIRGTDENGNDYLFMLRIDLINVGNAIRLRDKLWMSTIAFKTELHLV